MRPFPTEFARGLLGGFLLLTLAACVSTGQKAGEVPDNMPRVQQAAALLAGEFAEISGRAAAGEHVRIQAQVQRIGSQSVDVTITQFDGSTERRFVIELAPAESPNQLSGRFMPLNNDGAPVGSCPLVFSLREDGWLARTGSASCVFGEGDSAVALSKEIALDARTLVIADRLTEPETGRELDQTRVLELARVAHFSGWSGVRDSAAADWRTAASFDLASDGISERPEDAAGMPLGLELELAPHRLSRDGDLILRLRVFDVESGALVGQSWADRDATRIGLALPNLQVGLERVSVR